MSHKLLKVKWFAGQMRQTGVHLHARSMSVRDEGNEKTKYEEEPPRACTYNCSDIRRPLPRCYTHKYRPHEGR